MSTFSKCQLHNQFELNIHCRTCNSKICHECTLTNHKFHTITKLSSPTITQSSPSNKESFTIPFTLKINCIVNSSHLATIFCSTCRKFYCDTCFSQKDKDHSVISIYEIFAQFVLLLCINGNEKTIINEYHFNEEFTNEVKEKVKLMKNKDINIIVCDMEELFKSIVNGQAYFLLMDRINKFNNDYGMLLSKNIVKDISEKIIQIKKGMKEFSVKEQEKEVKEESKETFTTVLKNRMNIFEQGVQRNKEQQQKKKYEPYKKQEVNIQRKKQEK